MMHLITGLALTFTASVCGEMKSFPRRLLSRLRCSLLSASSPRFSYSPSEERATVTHRPYPYSWRVPCQPPVSH